MLDFPGIVIDLLGLFRKLQMQRQEDQAGTGGPVTQTRPSADPQNQTAAASNSLDIRSRLILGRITDATPVGQVYRVTFAGMKRPLVASYGSRTTTTRFGATEFTSLQPGTYVWCIIHPHDIAATIVMAVPMPNTDPSRGFFGMLHTSTRARTDAADQAPYTMEDNGGAISFSAGRPFDAILGDYGAMSETGSRLLIDSFMAQLGVTEMSQLTFYHHDMMAKLAAYNYLAWTCCTERESLNDQDEVSDWTGYATYPWEQLGQFRRQNPARIRTAEEWQKGSPAHSKIEPLDDYAMPFHREREWHGYLGQGGRTAVSGPPQGDRGGAYQTFDGGGGISQREILPGLYDEFTLLDGRHGMQSAKGISIIKRPVISLPKRRLRPEDNLGDNPKNYKFSGILPSEEGKPHNITGDIRVTGEHTSQVRAMGIMDMHAYFFNYANNQPFIAHTRDYAVPEESEAAWADGKSADTPTFSDLKTSMLLNADRYKKRLFIDDRYNEQDVYTLPCGLELLDDGGVVLFDGFGGEIRMTGGSVTISAPGDIWLKSGRNTNIWGGDDINMRALNSVDVVATNHDVRLKSESNMQLIAGNSGHGGLMLESRSFDNEFDFSKAGERAVTSGIVLRAPKSMVTTLASDIYLRTGSEDGSVRNGRIVLDAAKGKQEIFTISQSITCYAKDFVRFNFGNIGEPTHTAFFGKSLCTLPGTLYVGAHLAVAGSIYAKNDIVSVDGFIVAEHNENGLIYKPQDEQKEQLNDFIAAVHEQIEKKLPDAAKERFTAVITNILYAQGSIGNDATIAAASASLRVREDYGAGAFIVFEDRWQQLARLHNEQMPQWQEKEVKHPKGTSYPYPGEDVFATSAELLYQQGTTMFDVQTGQSRPHGRGDNISALYQSPAFAEQKGRALNTYTVVGGN